MVPANGRRKIKYQRHAKALRCCDDEYTVLRIWEVPVESLLLGGIGTLPLAPLADIVPDRLPEVVRRMRQRLDAEATTDADEGEFWTTTNILLGLRYPEAQISELLKGVRRMKESVTYQAILQEGEARGEARGRAQEARILILRMGRKRLGDLNVSTQSILDGITSVARLEQLAERLMEVESWDELLAES